MRIKKGPLITVNGEPFKTVIVDGVQRFHENRIVWDMLEVCRGECPPSWMKVAAGQRSLDLNEIALRVARKVYTENERRELYRMIGYSISGYAEIFPKDRIFNPLWEDKKTGTKRVRK